MDEATKAAWIADVEQHRQERINDLLQPDSWLTLAGLYWLEEGENTFGSDSSNTLIYPEKAPAYLGTYTFTQDSLIHVQIAPDARVTYNGEPVSSLQVNPSTEEGPVILEWESLHWFLIRRNDTYGIRLKDGAHPNLATFEGIDTFPIDLAWRLEGTFEPYDPPKTIPVLNVLNTISDTEVPGAAVFEVDGAAYRLDVTDVSDEGGLFVIFADKTNGKGSYGGGRYLWMDAPNENGRIVVDFNQSYNPPCVFTPYATCPLPPAHHRLPFLIEAGEKTYKYDVDS